MKKPKKSIGLESLGGLVYSTNSNELLRLEAEKNEGPEEVLSSDQNLRIWLDRKNRKGKAVTLITGFECTEKQLKECAKTLKSACGVGGSAKNNEIVIQGDHRQKVLSILINEGFKVKLAGG